MWNWFKRVWQGPQTLIAEQASAALETQLKTLFGEELKSVRIITPDGQSRPWVVFQGE